MQPHIRRRCISRGFRAERAYKKTSILHTGIPVAMPILIFIVQLFSRLLPVESLRLDLFAIYIVQEELVEDF